MIKNQSKEIETIANALLQLSDIVVEISRDHVITRIWESGGYKLADTSRFLGKKIVDSGNEKILGEIDNLVTNSFETRDNGGIEYTISHEQYTATYSIRILPIHPNKDFLFSVIKNLSKKEGVSLIEDKWKLALDAAGDGMWDVNLQTDKIYFSDKWHEAFGYTAAEITTRTQWAERVHPDDMTRYMQLRDDYLIGKTPTFTVEFRYLCKDGSYKWILSRGIAVSFTPDGKPLRFIGTQTDITDRKISEERYSGAAELLSKLINNLQNGVLVTDESRKIIFANQMFCTMYNIKGSPDQLVGKDVSKSLGISKYFYKEPDKFPKRTDEILEKNEIVLEEPWALADGRVFTRDYIPLTFGNNYKGGIWKFADVTDQKNEEKKLEEQRMFYEQVLNSIAADIVVFDAKHRYLFINPIAIKDSELRKWLIGKTDEDYCRAKDKPMSIAERRREIFNTAINERHPIEWEEKLHNPKGEIEYHLRIMFPVFDERGDLLMMIGYGLNITDRILAEQALKTSRDTFANAFDYSGIGMALISQEGRWLDVNNVLCDMIGYAKDELLKLTLQDITYPDDLHSDHALVKKLLTRQISTYNIEKRYVSKKKKIILVSLTVSVVWSNDDTPRFIIAQVVDITKRKELENELQRKNAEMEATRINLINKIAQLEDLSHIIAHNLRGPAANIKMLSRGLSAKYKGDSSESENSISELFTQEEALELIEESSSALMSSLATLMEITKIKLDKEIPYNECNIADLVNDITTQLYSTIFEKHAKIILNLEVNNLSYPKAYLENILYNFISNSLKYSRADVPPEIIISTQTKNGKVQVIVKDNGLGIDLSRYADRIFKLNAVFHQGYDSKGVGLYITKTQVESLGGKIEVKSKVNEGTEFIVTL